MMDGSFSDAGHVRVYEYSGGSWSQLGNDIDGEAVADFSGWSVSMNSDGDRVAIGASAGNDGNGSASGHVRVYEYSGGSWSQLGSDIDGEAVYDQSGFSVSMNSDGDRVAIGATYNDGSGSECRSCSNIYSWNGSSWNQLGQILMEKLQMIIWVRSVSMNSDGDTVAIGAR